MSDFGIPWGGFRLIETVSATISTSSANTKGAYVQATAACASDVHLIHYIGLGGDATHWWLNDIAIGGSGAEQIVLPNVADFQPQEDMHRTGLWVPVNIAAGTRIAMRGQCSDGAKSSILGVGLYNRSSFGAPQNFGNPSSMGEDTANSRGTVVTMTNTWQQIVASTPRNFQGLYLQYSPSNETAQAAVEIAVGIGGSGGEQAILDLPTTLIRPNFGVSELFYHIPVAIPEASRLSVRFTWEGGTVQNGFFHFLGY